MKKFISALAACSVLCAFTACGQKDSGDSEIINPPEYQQKISVSDIAVEYSTEPQQEAITVTTTTRTAYMVDLPPVTTAPYVPVQYIAEYTPETTYTASAQTTSAATTTTTFTTTAAQPENVIISSDIYSAVENYLECINNKDIYGIIKASYPDKYAAAIKNMTERTDIPLDDIIGDMYKEKNMHLSGANSYEALPEEYISRFSSLLGGFEPLSTYIEKNGAESIEDADLFTLLESLCGTSEAYFDITRAVKINCNISSGKDIKARDMCLYYIDGEGWKIDVVFMPCIQNIDKIKDNEFIDSLNTFIDDIGDFVEDNIVDRIHGYDDYYSDSYYYNNYYDDFDDFGDIFETGLNDLFDSIERF